MFQRSVVKEIFSRQQLNGFAFDVEILFITRKLSLEICEVPVNWHNREGSKVNLVTDSMRMLWDIARLKMIHLRFK
jgi:dolichyl-phosphate beta-glucosyltransferase